MFIFLRSHQTVFHRGCPITAPECAPEKVGCETKRFEEVDAQPSSARPSFRPPAPHFASVSLSDWWADEVRPGLQIFARSGRIAFIKESICRRLVVRMDETGFPPQQGGGGMQVGGV